MTVRIFAGLRCWGHQRALRQFVMFCLVGGINTAVDYGAYLALTRFTSAFTGHYLRAAAISFSLGVLSSFVLNTFWTFGAGGAGWYRRVPQFLAVALVGLLLNSLIISVAMGFGLHDLLAKVVATGLVIAWNFLAQKHWTFKAAC